MDRSRVVVIGLLGLIICPSSASTSAAENLAPNGNFDTDLSGWAAFPSGATGMQWSPDDADGAPDSGSAEINAPLRSSRQLRTACVPVVGGRDYVFGAALKRAGTSEYFNRTVVFLTWRRGAACDNDSVLAREEILATSRAWKTTSRIVSAPADATSANLSLGVSVTSVPHSGTGGIAEQDVAVTGNFDNIVFAPLPCEGTCGDTVPDTLGYSVANAAVGLLTSSDALYILRGAIGEETCPSCICDVNDSGDVSATDALLTLAAATGEAVSLTCPE